MRDGGDSSNQNSIVSDRGIRFNKEKDRSGSKGKGYMTSTNNLNKRNKDKDKDKVLDSSFFSQNESSLMPKN